MILTTTPHNQTSRGPVAAGALFANSVIRGMNGEKGVVTPTFVKSPLYEDQGIEYFSSNVELGVSSRRLFFFPFTSHHSDVDNGVEDGVKM